jgi:lysophospholipase L1-like esterase
VAAPRAPTAELERLVRYCHPAKLLARTRLPGLHALDDETLARLYGTPVGDYLRLAQALRESAHESARALARRPEIRRAVASLPLRPGERLLAVGDSHTDDRASWAEILRDLLADLRGADGIAVVNAGVSGDTTTALLATAAALPDAALAVVMIATNDARRHGRDGAPMLVSHRESQRNLRAIDRILRERARRVLWITPPPVDARRIAADPALRAADLTWREADVAHKAALVRALDGDRVDLWPDFGAEHLAADGLHASAAGQRAIVQAVLSAAARLTAPRAP